MRIASQLTFCSPQELLKRTVVEQNQQGVITGLFSLDNNLVESSRTLFFDGIISAEIISLKANSNDYAALISDYHYVDLANDLPAKIIPSDKPLILDFGTDSPVLINRFLESLVSALDAYSIEEIIAACTYYPALLLETEARLCINRKTGIVLWEGTDLVNKLITTNTRIRKMS